MPAPHPHSCRGLKPGPWRFSRAAKHAAPGGACAGGSQRAGDAHVTASDSVSLRARGGRERGRRCPGPLRSRGPCEGQVAPGEVSEPAAHRPPSPRGQAQEPGRETGSRRGRPGAEVEYWGVPGDPSPSPLVPSACGAVRWALAGKPSRCRAGRRGRGRGAAGPGRTRPRCRELRPFPGDSASHEPLSCRGAWRPQDGQCCCPYLLSRDPDFRGSNSGSPRGASVRARTAPGAHATPAVPPPSACGGVHRPVRPDPTRASARGACPRRQRFLLGFPRGTQSHPSPSGSRPKPCPSILCSLRTSSGGFHQPP